MYPGKGFAGQVRTADIGFTEDSLEYSGWDGLVPEPSELERLRNRQADGNKGTFGRVLIVAGSRGMCGAAYLSGLAAYRTGAGLVKLLTVPETGKFFKISFPKPLWKPTIRRSFLWRKENFFWKTVPLGRCHCAGAGVGKGALCL